MPTASTAPATPKPVPSALDVIANLLRWLVELVLFGALGCYLVLNAVLVALVHAGSGRVVFSTVLAVCVVAIVLFAWVTLTDLILVLERGFVLWPTLTRVVIVLGLGVLLGVLGLYLGPE